MRHNYIIAPIHSILREIQPDCNYIFLSLREDLPIQDNVLVVNCLDTEEENHVYAFDKEKHARQILNFVMEAKNEDVFICCDAGESRSPAVAAALYEYEYGETADHIWKSKDYHPNMHVYRSMKECLRSSSSSQFV